MTQFLLQGIIHLNVLLNAYKSIYSEIFLKSLKNNPSEQAEFLSSEQEASRVISAEDMASAEEAIVKSEKYA